MRSSPCATARFSLVLDNLEQLGAATAPVAELLARRPARARPRDEPDAAAALRRAASTPCRRCPAPVTAGASRRSSANDAVRLFAARAQAVDPEFALTDGNVESVAESLPPARRAAARDRARGRAHQGAVARCDRGAARPLARAARRRRARPARAPADAARDARLELRAARRPRSGSCWRRVSVFAGGWTLADADAVLGRDTSLGLEALIDSSLVRRRTTADGRRASGSSRRSARTPTSGCTSSGRGRAAPEPRAPLRDVAARAWEDIRRGGDPEANGATRVLEREHDNLRAAIAWADETGEIDLEARLVARAALVLARSGPSREGRRAFERADREDDGRPRPPGRGCSRPARRSRGGSATATRRRSAWRRRSPSTASSATRTRSHAASPSSAASP